MEKEWHNLNPEVLKFLEDHPNKKEILKILSEDPDKWFEFSKTKTEIIKQEIEKLISQLLFENIVIDNYYEYRVYLDRDYVWFVSFLVEGSHVTIINFWTSNKKVIANDLSIKLIEELSKMWKTNIKYLGFSILYKLFKVLRKKDVKFFHITSSKGSIDFYKKFFNFMEDIWEVELWETQADNIFEGFLI